jgi:hypothetical protein
VGHHEVDPHALGRLAAHGIEDVGGEASAARHRSCLFRRAPARLLKYCSGRDY